MREAPNDVVVLNVMAEGARERPTVEEARQWRSLYQLLFTVVADVDGAWVDDWGEGLNWRSHAVLDMDGKVVYHTNEDHVGILEDMKRVIRATPGPE